MYRCVYRYKYVCMYVCRYGCMYACRYVRESSSDGYYCGYIISLPTVGHLYSRCYTGDSILTAIRALHYITDSPYPLAGDCGLKSIRIACVSVVFYVYYILNTATSITYVCNCSLRSTR